MENPEDTKHLENSIDVERIDTAPLSMLASQAIEKSREQHRSNAARAQNKGDKGYQDAYSEYRLGKLSMHVGGNSPHKHRKTHEGSRSIVNFEACIEGLKATKSHADAEIGNLFR